MCSSKKNGEKSKQKSTIKLTAEVPVKYYLVSAEQLTILKNGIKDSASIDYSLFFFGLSSSLLVAFLTWESAGAFWSNTLIVSSIVCLFLGYHNYQKYRNSKKDIDVLLKKIKSNECNISDQ